MKLIIKTNKIKTQLYIYLGKMNPPSAEKILRVYYFVFVLSGQKKISCGCTVSCLVCLFFAKASGPTCKSRWRMQWKGGKGDTNGSDVPKYVGPPAATPRLWNTLNFCRNRLKKCGTLSELLRAGNNLNSKKTHTETTKTLQICTRPSKSL